MSWKLEDFSRTKYQCAVRNPSSISVALRRSLEKLSIQGGDVSRQWGNSHNLIQRSAVECSHGEMSENLHKYPWEKQSQLWMSASPGEYQIMGVPAKFVISCLCLLVWVWGPGNEQSREKRKEMLYTEVLTITQYWNETTLWLYTIRTISIIWE